MLSLGKPLCSRAQLSLLLLSGLLQLLQPSRQNLTACLCLLPCSLVGLCVLLKPQAQLAQSCLLIFQLPVALLELKAFLIKLVELALEAGPLSVELGFLSDPAVGQGLHALLELFCGYVKGLSGFLKLGLQDVCPSALLTSDSASSGKLCGGLPEDADLVIQPSTHSQEV